MATGAQRELVSAQLLPTGVVVAGTVAGVVVAGSRATMMLMAWQLLALMQAEYSVKGVGGAAAGSSRGGSWSRAAAEQCR